MMAEKLIIFAVLALMPCALADGQKADDAGPVGIFSSRAEYNRFMGDAKRVAYGPEGSPELRAMIPLLNDIALNQPIGSTAGKFDVQASTLGLLSDQSIRAELEMVDSQFEDLQRVHAEIQTQMAEQIRRLDFKDTDGLVEQIRALGRQARGDLDSVLLPHQLTRLRQIQMQSQLRRRSFVDVLTSDPVKSELEITQQQSDELRQAEKEIEQDLAEEIARLREQARGRLLAKLKPEQKRQVEQMFGDAFDFTERGRGKSQDRRRSK